MIPTTPFLSLSGPHFSLCGRVLSGGLGSNGGRVSRSGGLGPMDVVDSIIGTGVGPRASIGD